MLCAIGFRVSTTGVLLGKDTHVATTDELAETILRYLTSRPNACDTVEGICEWWIPRQRYLDCKTDVLAALELLRARGVLKARASADGRVLYRAASDGEP